MAMNEPISKQLEEITSKLIAWSPEAPRLSPLFEGARKVKDKHGVMYRFRDGSKGYLPRGTAKLQAIRDFRYCKQLGHDPDSEGKCKNCGMWL